MSDTFTSLYLQDPATAIRMRQLQAAQRLRQEGSSSAPVQHWTQGLSRILQSFVGAQDERTALDAMRQDQQQQRSEADTFMRGLMGGGNVQQLVAAAQQPAPQAVSPAPGEPQQPAPTVPPRANFTVPGGDIYGGRGGPALAARDGALGAGPTQLAALSAGRASDIGQPLNNPAVTGPNSELPGWDAGLGAPTGRINPLVGGNPGGPAPTPAAPAPATASGASMMSAALAAMSSNNPLIRQRAPVLMQLAQRQMEEERRGRERTEDRGYRVEDRDIALAEARAARAAEAARSDRTFGLQERQLAATLANQGVPAGYRRTAAGGMEFIPGGPADPEVLRSRAQTGLVPIQAYDREGNPTVLLPRQDGTLTQPQLPEGTTLTPQTREINTGTEIQTVDRGGRVVASRPINIVGREAQEAIGQATGQQIATAPAAFRTAEQSLGNIDAVLNHPALNSTTGMLSLTGAIPGTPMFDFAQRVDQLRGQAFLQAFDNLRGGGAITEREGQAATQALARLNRNLSASDLRQALGELRAIVEGGRQRALDMARQNPAFDGGGVQGPAPGLRADPPSAQPRGPAVIQYDAQGRRISP